MSLDWQKALNKIEGGLLTLFSESEGEAIEYGRLIELSEQHLKVENLDREVRR